MIEADFHVLFVWFMAVGIATMLVVVAYSLIESL